MIKFISSDVKRNGKTQLIEPIEITIDGEERKVFNVFINKVMDVENLIVLAGSGTSLTFNKENEERVAPSMWDLWEACRKSNIDLFKKILDIIEYDKAQVVRNVDGSAKQDIELLLSLCDSNLSIGRLTPDDLANVSAFMRGAKKVILEETSFTDKVDMDSWSPHNKFINILGRRSIKQNRLKLFTTNYDVAFEYAASNIGFIIIDGFDYSNPSRFNPMWFQYDIVHRGNSNDKAVSFLPNIMQLYKIHGSIDWKVIDGYIQKSTDSNKEPVFIYPSSTKYQSSYNSPYLEMMSSFLSAVQKPKTAIIVVGFGFNDKHINNAITMALRTNPEFMLMVATKDPFSEKSNFNKSMKDLFIKSINNGDSRIAMVDSTFSDFVNHLPERRNISPEEEILKAFSVISSTMNK
ncbi:SIR2 family protein [Serratia plymuthica]|uniref:SIR2 family protein n=1 Tax=Serratia plymuthica TaxID=82996 RepID=UPI00390CBABC